MEMQMKRKFRYAVILGAEDGGRILSRHYRDDDAEASARRYQNTPEGCYSHPFVAPIERVSEILGRISGASGTHHAREETPMNSDGNDEHQDGCVCRECRP